MMIRGDILGGLKLALSRGDSLQNAMQSFYNSGYKKEEIEEAARALHQQVSQQPPQKQMPQTSQQPIQQSLQQPKPVSQAPQTYASPKPAPITYSPHLATQTSQIPKQETQRTPMQKPYFSYQNPEDNFIPPEEKESIVNRFKQLRTSPQAEQTEKVSTYAEYKRPGLDAVTVILIIILLALLGVLAAVFFFKDNLIEFLNKFLD